MLVVFAQLLLSAILLLLGFAEDGAVLSIIKGFTIAVRLDRRYCTAPPGPWEMAVSGAWPDPGILRAYADGPPIIQSCLHFTVFRLCPF
jgi:hypothetical protein